MDVKITDSTCCFTLEININNYMENTTECKKGFFVWPLNKAGEAVVQVIGRSIIRDNKRSFVLSSATIRSLTNDGMPIHEDFIKFITPSLQEEGVNPPLALNKILVFHPDENGQIAFTYIVVNCPNFPQHKKNLEKFLRESRSAVIAAFELSRERYSKEKCLTLLTTTKSLLLQLSDLSELMHAITVEARRLTKADHCALFLVSEKGDELMAKAFDEFPHDIVEEIRMPISHGFAGRVVTTGTYLNINEAANHPLNLDKNLDEIGKFKTRNVLCFPIRDNRKRVVGVLQLCNKEHGFTTMDEEAISELVTYSGISLMHSIVYKKIQQSQARSRLTNEVLMHHLAVDEETLSEVVNCKHNHDYEVMLDWSWFCRDGHLNSTPCLALHMFETLGFIESCRMDRSTVARFVLIVKKSYRNVPYHNWLHAFSAAHFSFYVMKQLDVIEKSWITELEGIALFVSLLCHDLDHRGTNNSFQIISKNMLACLYSSEGSIMERHHFAQTLCILNSDGCNIFENLDTAAYRRVLDLIRDFILATDLASHFSRLSKVNKITQSYDPEIKEHRSLLLSLLMTASDLCDQTKGWSHTRLIANQIYEEFFTQGDIERSMGCEPNLMMDRTRADVPTLQVQFMVKVCLPCYKTLAKFFPPLEPCVASVEDGLRKWRMAKKWIDLQEPAGKTVMEFLNDPELELHINDEENDL